MQVEWQRVENPLIKTTASFAIPSTFLLDSHSNRFAVCGNEYLFVILRFPFAFKDFLRELIFRKISER